MINFILFLRICYLTSKKVSTRCNTYKKILYNSHCILRSLVQPESSILQSSYDIHLDTISIFLFHNSGIYHRCCTFYNLRNLLIYILWWRAGPLLSLLSHRFLLRFFDIRIGFWTSNYMWSLFYQQMLRLSLWWQWQTFSMPLDLFLLSFLITMELGLLGFLNFTLKIHRGLRSKVWCKLFGEKLV